MNHSTAEQISQTIEKFVAEFPEFTQTGELPRILIEEDYRLYRWFPGMKGTSHPTTNYDIPSIATIGMIPPIAIIEEMLKLRNLQYPERILTIYIDGNMGTCSFYVKISVGREGV